MKKDQDPMRTAAALIGMGFTVDRYEKIQDERRKRLLFFKEREIKVLVKAEEELISFGQEVIAILKLNGL